MPARARSELTELGCPRCGRDFVRRVRRQGAADHLLSFLYVYPFRCQLCAHRFYGFRWGVQYSRRPVDRRQYQRVAARVPVTFWKSETSGQGTMTLVSLGGCVIETDAPPEAGEILRLQLQKSHGEVPIAVDAAVVRSVRPPKVGLEFLRLRPDEKERLARLVISLLDPKIQ